MPKDQSFHDYIAHDLLGDFSGISSRAMFSGWGIYKDGLIFGIIVGGELYFKVGASNLEDFKTAGSHPFVYDRAGKKVSLSYWLVPEQVLEDRELLSSWVEKALQASKKSKVKE